MGSDMSKRFKSSIEGKLAEHNIRIKDVKKRIIFDTEERCHYEHGGNWKKRLEGVKNARHA